MKQIKNAKISAYITLFTNAEKFMFNPVLKELFYKTKYTSRILYVIKILKHSIFAVNFYAF